MLVAMDIVDLAQARRFADARYQKVSLFDASRLLLDQYCLLPGQAQQPHRHADVDKAYLVLEGEALVTIGEERELVPAGCAVLAPAGVSHGVANESDSKLVLLVLRSGGNSHAARSDAPGDGSA